MTVPKTIAGLGPIVQIAFVPRDFEAALGFWTGTMGVGPFFLLEHIPVVDVRYRGRPIEIDQTAALGYWGDLQVELIRQHDDGPSVYREWLAAGREGLQHVGVRVADMGVARRVLEARGGVPVHEATLPGAAEAAYYQLPGPGPIVEAIRMEPVFDALFDYMRRAAKDWDGRDPVRPAPPQDEWMS